jgi:glycosyltransferase involved in cell wall biosynthesis
MKYQVLHLIKSLGRGGAEMLLPETLKLHDKDKFEFHYGYFLPWKNQMVESIQQYGGKVVCFKANNNLQLLSKARAVALYVRENRIQLIHAHLPWAGVLARIVGKMCDVPVIYTEHNKLERYHGITRALNLLTMNYMTVMIAVSQDVSESIRKYKRNYRIPVRVVTNGVNVEHFDPENFNRELVRKKYNIPSDAFIIGTVAVFRFQKRLDLWIALAGKILERCPHAHFIIVGDGPLKATLLEKRRELGLEERIHMPGLETEVRHYLATFDLYMMCSIFEGLPIALLEAMAMKCAVISTDAGGIGEVIRNEIDGMLCPISEPEQLVDYACRLSGDQTLRMQYKENARKRVLEFFSIAKMVKELENIYYEVLRLP